MMWWYLGIAVISMTGMATPGLIGPFKTWQECEAARRTNIRQIVDASKHWPMDREILAYMPEKCQAR